MEYEIEQGLDKNNILTIKYAIDRVKKLIIFNI
jgi:hypothetical protein